MGQENGVDMVACPMAGMPDGRHARPLTPKDPEWFSLLLLNFKTDSNNTSVGDIDVKMSTRENNLL